MHEEDETDGAGIEAWHHDVRMEELPFKHSKGMAKPNGRLQKILDLILKQYITENVLDN